MPLLVKSGFIIATVNRNIVTTNVTQTIQLIPLILNIMLKIWLVEGMRDKSVSKRGLRQKALSPKRKSKSRDPEELLKFGIRKQNKIYEKDITNTSKYESNIKNY